MEQIEIDKIMNSSKGIRVLYDIIREYVIVGPMSSDKLRKFVFDNYYNKGMLASCISIETLSNITGAPKSLVKKNIKLLEKSGFIRTNRIQRMDMIDIDLDVDSNIDVFIVGESKEDEDYYYINN